MAFPDLSRLLSQLNTSGLQQSNPPLYQVIKQLIQFAQQVEDQLVALLDTTNNNVTDISNQGFLTWNDSSLVLSNSRQLVAGTNITFDDSTPNQRTINASGSGGGSFDPSAGYYAPVTSGDPEDPSIVFNSNGDAVMVWVPTP